MGVFENILFGFQQIFAGYNYLLVIVGAFLGVWIGMLPGIGASTGIALLIPFTYALGPTSALIMLCGIYFGTMYGSAISAILINTPGAASSVMTALDGHPLARKGRGGAALFISAISSFTGGTLGLIGLTFIATPLSRLAVQLGPPEYFMLMVFAFVATATLLEGSIIKGFLAGFIGLIIGTVGVDLQTGSARFAFGQPRLWDGIPLLTVVIGVFAIAEALTNLEKIVGGRWRPPETVGKLWATGAEWVHARFAMLRGAVIGFCVGIFPGAGGAIATLFAYSVERRISSRPDQFGKGAIEGVAAPEAANSALVSGAMIPMLTLGIPGSSATAVMLGALMMHGIQPGPMLYVEHPEIAWGIISSLYMGNIVLIILSIPLIGIWVRLLKIPGTALNTTILLMGLTGAYALNNNIFDVYLAVAFGLMGYALRKQDFPFAPMILGLVLGGTLEQSLRQSLTLSANDWSIFFTRPVCAALFLFSLLCIAKPLFSATQAAFASGMYSAKRQSQSKRSKIQ